MASNEIVVSLTTSWWVGKNAVTAGGETALATEETNTSKVIKENLKIHRKKCLAWVSWKKIQGYVFSEGSKNVFSAHSDCWKNEVSCSCPTEIHILLLALRWDSFQLLNIPMLPGLHRVSRRGSLWIHAALPLLTIAREGISTQMIAWIELALPMRTFPLCQDS